MGHPGCGRYARRTAGKMSALRGPEAITGVCDTVKVGRRAAGAPLAQLFPVLNL